VFHDAGVDLIVGSVTSRLRRLQLAPEVLVTRMHGAMGAAPAGQSPLGWRERFGPMPPAEALAWASTSWLLADPWSTTSVRSEVSATGSSRCCSQWTQNRAAESDAD